jgi:DNA-binding CsgD family transcriptional regulator
MATGDGLNQPARRVIDARRREAEILELRYQGTPLAEIAKRYGISVARVSKLYYRALARIAEPIADLERKRTLEVADKALARLWTIEQTETDPELRIKISLSILRWEECRSRLLGLDDLPRPAMKLAVNLEQQQTREEQMILVRAMTPDERRAIQEIERRAKERVQVESGKIKPAVIEATAGIRH